MLRFDSKYPEKVARMVLIDGVSPGESTNFSLYKSIKFLQTINKNSWLSKLAIEMGLVGEWNKRKRPFNKKNATFDKALIKETFANCAMIETAKQVKQFVEGSHSILHLTHRKEIVSQINDFVDGILPKK